MKVTLMLGIAYVLSATYAQDSTFEIVCKSNPLMTEQVDNLQNEVDSVAQTLNNMKGQVDQVQLLLDNQTKDFNEEVDKLAKTKQVEDLHEEVDSVAQTVKNMKGQVDQVQLLLENQAKDFKVAVDKLAKMLEKVIKNKATIWLPLKTGTYAFLVEPHTWYEAKDKCNEIGGYLLEINSQEEQDLVVKTSQALGWDKLKLNFWLGLNDIEKEGTWVWDDSQRGVNDGYTNWNDVEPNNYAGNEDCAHTGSRYKWNDCECDHKKKLGKHWTGLAAVCEREG